ncbi:hypothetical protein [Psychromonas aquimarina]|uniref:hypothetical protein n=1 Tax=Psychromonas aquimarina TaxID=444919 RepID=UPI00041178E4|nr:hypothetical protein [Psychromonas aquimarina]
MNFSSEIIGKGKDAETTISWLCNEVKISKHFSSTARYIFVESDEVLFVAVYKERKIHAYNLEGSLIGSYSIPLKEGYQYRGINLNHKSKSGISLLYFPIEDGYGNKWGDIEQYEFICSETPLGVFLNIYR